MKCEFWWVIFELMCLMMKSLIWEGMKMLAAKKFFDERLNILGGEVLGLEYPKDGIIRARKVISRSKARGSGKYPSWKMRRMIHWESPHELNAFRILDANPAVLNFAEQPLTVNYAIDGIKHKHYPDVQVTTRSGRELWEVKTSADAAALDVVRRTKLLSSVLPTFGFVYRVVLADDLAAQPRLNNVLKVLRLGRTEIPDIERERLRLTLGQLSVLKWRDVRCGALGAQGLYFVCRLILEGAIEIDLAAPILDSSQIILRP
jgi:hypothetical protein